MLSLRGVSATCYYPFLEIAPLTDAIKLLALILLIAGDMAARGGNFGGKILAAVEFRFGN